MKIERWGSSSLGRSRTVAFGPLVWTVSNALDLSAGFENQAAESLSLLESSLEEAGSNRHQLLSIQVLLADLRDRPAFDAQWQKWIGPNPEHWPQRSCLQVVLASGLLLELVAVAAREDRS